MSACAIFKLANPTAATTAKTDCDRGTLWTVDTSRCSAWSQGSRLLVEGTWATVNNITLNAPDGAEYESCAVIPPDWPLADAIKGL